ncbi:MAG: winged helix-turn-helix transcriptional regulator [Chloroflexi bacterium]|nr:winged helix-turn-helix transcriptional regulator [Chloroflexota bacterium]MCI0855844.1 winged helix-turn-helix transcriptional regulator [Chloroflexota bacterium]MCI0890569.1 winged helix-turn-helix transcriptional regulator [Chloroflexota bacterium]
MDTMTALADPVRRQVVELLADEERTAGEIGERFAIAQPSMSRHLRVLREAGVVSVRADGNRRIYSLNPRPLEEIEGWAARHLEKWHRKFDRLGSYLDQMGAAELDAKNRGT